MNRMATKPRGGNDRIAVVRLAESDLSVHHGAAADEFIPPEQLATLLPKLERHPELDLDTIGYHLTQSDATARDGYWHAAVNEARSFLEALVMSIALLERKESLAQFRKGKETQGGLRLCRRYLQDVGFLDIDEDILLSRVYSIASAKGSHLGVTDEAWSLLVRRIIWATGRYVIERYDAWKSTDRRRNMLGLEGKREPPCKTPAPARWRSRLATAMARAAQSLAPTR